MVPGRVAEGAPSPTASVSPFLLPSPKLPTSLPLTAPPSIRSGPPPPNRRAHISILRSLEALPLGQGHPAQDFAHLRKRHGLKGALRAVSQDGFELLVQGLVQKGRPNQRIALPCRPMRNVHHEVVLRDVHTEFLHQQRMPLVEFGDILGVVSPAKIPTLNFGGIRFFVKSSVPMFCRAFGTSGGKQPNWTHVRDQNADDAHGVYRSGVGGLASHHALHTTAPHHPGDM